MLANRGTQRNEAAGEAFISPGEVSMEKCTCRELGSLLLSLRRLWQKFVLQWQLGRELLVPEKERCPNQLTKSAILHRR